MSQLFNFGLLKTVHLKKAQKFDGGKIFQLSFYNVAEVKCLIIILDIAENVDNNNSVIVVAKDFVMSCSVDGLNKVLGHLRLSTFKAKIIPSSPTSLLGVCLNLIPSDLLYLTQ